MKNSSHLSTQMWDIENRIELSERVIKEAEVKLSPNFGFSAQKNIMMNDVMNRTFSGRVKTELSYKLQAGQTPDYKLFKQKVERSLPVGRHNHVEAISFLTKLATKQDQIHTQKQAYTRKKSPFAR